MPARSSPPTSPGSPFAHLPSPAERRGVQPAASGGRQVRPPVVRTRTGAAWVGITVAVVVLILLIVFMLQNTASVEVAFFGLRGTAPLSVTLLIAGVGFAVVTLIVGSLRIGQLRRRIGNAPDAVGRTGDQR